jgi:hypothetical protein
MSKSVQLTPNEVSEFLNFIIQNNIELQKVGKKPSSVEIIGEAGLGKTSIVEQIARENNLEFVKLNLSQIEELGDLVGFPIRQFEMCTAAEASCLWIDEHAISTYEKQGYKFTGHKRMAYCPPSWIADKEGSTGGILLLDDWTRGDIRFIQACMELIDRQEYISWKLPPGWTVLLTSNPSGGNYMVNEIDAAQKTRFISVEMSFDKKSWAKWAESAGIDGRCINFILLHPEVVQGDKVNPRSLVTFFNAISNIQDFSAKLPFIQMIGEGCIGSDVTSMFIMFINNKLDKLVTPETIMHKDWLLMEPEVKACVGYDINYRADIASVLAHRTINYMIEYAKSNPVKKDHIDRIEKIAETSLLGIDLNFIIVKELFQSGPKFKEMGMRQRLVKLVAA